MFLSSRPAIAAASTALVLLLAACSGGTTATDGTDTDTPAAPVEPAPDDARPPADDGGDGTDAGDDAPASTIPARWHGDWAADDAGCREPDAHIERLTISADELRFHESIAVPRSVETLDADSIRVESDYAGEGQQWTATQVLRLSNGDASLQVDGPDGASMTRVRCEPAAQ
ncbi:MAG: hypothetical protein A2579_07345 [Lysobacterales bacterium RIFOXYD1_FULL_69_11]|nr:MAG: hypothetical protein A2190_14160 [Xanthomonadales bacterium RIFOXYA1_FULL_69_10]OHE86217.1 MAG: hypothetical protein A2579_07345 [Xanthomonadales bacterium RIFOXYD1_FULL_69_11]